MLILALEFSSPVRSVALSDQRGAEPNSEILGSLADDGNRAVKPLSMIDTVLTRAGIERRFIEGIVVGLGPGSYTGIRSAIALAQGWQLATGLKLAGVSSVECLARQAQTKGWFGRVTIAIDAQRNEVYLADYEITAEALNLVAPLRLNPIAALANPIKGPEHIAVGPEITRWCPTGRVLFPDARQAGRLVHPGTHHVPGEQLEPIYLREPAFVKASPPPGTILTVKPENRGSVKDRD